MKNIVIALALTLTVFVLPIRSYAESSLEVVLYDSLVGAGIGALIGASTLAFMDHPGDHLRRVPQGASIGLIAGVAFGIYEIKPVLYSRVDSGPGDKKDRIYGLQLYMPLK